MKKTLVNLLNGVFLNKKLKFYTIDDYLSSATIEYPVHMESMHIIDTHIGNIMNTSITCSDNILSLCITLKSNKNLYTILLKDIYKYTYEIFDDTLIFENEFANSL